MMKLESLPNEILLALFDYFYGIDLLQAFYGLNYRFNFLLYHQVRSYYFQFSSISKRNFDRICQQHLPFILDQIITLKFSDNCDTPEQINILFSYFSSMQHFTHLRYLSVDLLHSYQTLLKLLVDCQHLNGLTHLKLSSCTFQDPQTNLQIIMDKIWSLPKLSNVYVDINLDDEEQVLCIPTIISTSLEYVTIFKFKLKLNHVYKLIDYTPRLKHLSAYIEFDVNDNYIPSALSTLTKLRIPFVSSRSILKMIDFFKNIPNLRHLDINIWSELIDGHQWEQLIRNYMPMLKTFRLRMRDLIFSEKNIQRRANNLIDSFRRSFWIDEHKWFVRCFTSKKTIYLYTLSGSSDDAAEIYSDFWKSTYPNDNRQNFYNRITRINDETIIDYRISSDIRLPNIKYLRLNYLINDKFWSIVSNLNQLKSLTIFPRSETFLSELQTLLDRAPNLDTLRIEQDESLPLQASIFKYINVSVRYLDLGGRNIYFNREECITLTHSSLGIPCEVLWISVNNRQSILDLVTNMYNLRALIVKCADDESLKQSVSTQNNDELISWLADHLPSTYLIVRDPEVDETNVLIWI